MQKSEIENLTSLTSSLFFRDQFDFLTLYVFYPETISRCRPFHDYPNRLYELPAYQLLSLPTTAFFFPFVSSSLQVDGAVYKAASKAPLESDKE